jgi:hypothetical protein
MHTCVAMSTCRLTRTFERFRLERTAYSSRAVKAQLALLLRFCTAKFTLPRLLRSAGLVSAGLASLAVAGWSSLEPAEAREAESPVAQQLASGVDRPPLMLLAVGRRAADLFEAARVSNWRDAALALQGMRESAAAIPGTFSNLDVASKFQIRLQDVGDAVSARQRLQTMDFANGITRLVADLSEEYKPEGPYALVLLGYYGRELALGIESNDQARLRRAVGDLRQTWNRFERIVLQRGAVDEARRFTDIVVQLEGATAPGEFVDPTRAELDAVNSLEKIFNP